MAKVPTEPLDLVGFYLPRKSVDWDGLVADPKSGELVKEPSMTKQSFKEECDINTIVRRFEATGQIDHINKATREGLFIDLPDGVDLQGALNQVAQAEAAFMSLPADARAAFGNDPVQFVDALHYGTPETQEVLIKYGLAKDLRLEAPPPSSGSGPPPSSSPPKPSSEGGGSGNGGGAP